VNRALRAAFDELYDPRVGIVAELCEAERGRGAPDWFHAAAVTADPGPLGGVPGRCRAGAAGSSRDAAFAGAVSGAVTRYAAALYERVGLPLAPAAEAPFAAIEPRHLALFGDAQYRQPGFAYVPFTPATPIRWASTIDLATGSIVHVPAAIVWYPFLHFRRAGDLPVLPPWTGGLACGDGVAAASLAGLYDVVAKDAAAMFWQSMTAPPRIVPETLPPELRTLAARFAASGADLTLLDVTTDNRIPAVVAVLAATRADDPALAFAVAADLDPARAVAQALAAVAETRRRAKAALAAQPTPSPANDWEDVIDAADHLAVAADRDNAARFAFLFESDDRRHLADREDGTTGSVAGDLDQAIGRIALTGARVLSANLTSADLADLGLAVCRVVVPGYQPLVPGHAARPLGGARLYEVPQKLGHRGLPQGSPGNPTPHPFG
jgi:ribosomal protein S12 methylthiotransferase accessory factor